MTASSATVQKARTGIAGFDTITAGGLPCGRTTVVTGPAGCGKTLFGIEFVIHGIEAGDGPGAYVTFDESPDKLAQNVASLGFDLSRLQAEGSLTVHSFDMSRITVVETGPFTLDGLFLQLERLGAKRVVLDTVEVLFAAFGDRATIRSELVRLVRWFEQRGITAVITSERTEAKAARESVEEYVSDCVVVLDHRVDNGISTRRLRVAKYRGSAHGTNEYPFLISASGIAVLPITAVALDYPAPTRRLSTGVARLDYLLGGGFYQAGTLLISGSSGTGKTTLAAHFADAACARGERVLFLLYEESPQQIIRDLRSVGIDLQRWLDAGLLLFDATRPAAYGLETHLVSLHGLVERHRPDLVVLDPVTGFLSIAPLTDTAAMITRQADLLRSKGITCVLTALSTTEATDAMISSLIDTWILLRNVETSGERNRLLFVIKSRGSDHSNQVREFLITDAGVDLVDVYVGDSGVLTGTARLNQEARERRDAELDERRRANRHHDITQQIAALETHIASLRRQVESHRDELTRLEDVDDRTVATAHADTITLARRRRADPTTDLIPTIGTHA